MHDHPDSYTCNPSCPEWSLPATGDLPPGSGGPAGIDAHLAELKAEEARRSELASQLEAWWADRSHQEMEGAIPKAIEYSSTDLVDLGRQIACLAGWAEFDDAHLAELGIAFYVAGKISRVMGAIRDGRLPSEDTWHDIAVYTKMVQRVRDVGGWPGL